MISRHGFLSILTLALCLSLTALAANEEPKPESSDRFKNDQVELSAGLERIAFSAAGVPESSRLVPNLGLGYRMPWRRTHWSFGADLSATILALSVNSKSVRFLDAGVSAAYSFGKASSPWRLDLVGGASYSTMFGTSGQFGYSNLLFPQLYPRLYRYLGTHSRFGIYAKYFPLSTDWRAFDSANRLLAFGAQFEHEAESRRSWFASLDYNQLKLNDNNAGIVRTAWILSVGAGF